METLKFNKLIFSGKRNDALKFKPYFKNIISVKNNQEILTFPFAEKKIIFFNCDEENHNCIEIIKKIREQDRRSIIIIMSKEKNKNILFDVLPLHLSGYLKKPFKKNDIEKLLLNIKKDLLPLHHEENIHLQNDYSFNSKQLTLFDDQYNIIKLTKNELKLMEILTKEKGSYVNSETIEYYIWEEESLEQDCNTRLKHLIYCLRKKLPEESIINAYDLGYKLIIAN